MTAAAKQHPVRRIRTLSPLALKAEAATMAWLRGMNEGGHIASLQDIAEVHATALAHYGVRS